MSALPLANPVSVVIVDDTPDLRELLRFALEQHDFIVLAEAADGRQGLEQVERHQPDLVLLDLAMPVMDGFEALPRMRRLCPRAKIVVLSGFDAGAMSARAHDLGADGYLQKGQSLSATISYVHEVLGPRDPAPAAPPLAVVPPVGPAPVETPAPVSPVPSWARSAPFGVLALEDGPGLPVLGANSAAADLLGVPVRAGVTLAAVAPRLAGLVSAHEGAGSARLELAAATGGRAPLGVTLTRDAPGLWLVLTRPAGSPADG